MNKFLKVISLTLAFVVSTMAAVIAGAFLAVWDSDNAQDVYAMIVPQYEPIEAIPHQVVKKEADIKSVVDDIDKNEKKLEKNEIKGVEVSGFEAIKLPESEDEDDDGLFEIHEIDFDEEPEEKPIRITDEISGITNIVRAGSKDEVQLGSSLPANAEQAENTNTESEADPIATYPLPFTTVDESYFADALFIGDSRMQGFGMYSKVNATFYAQTAFQLYKYKTFNVVQTPEGKVPIFDVMPYDKFTKIYIKVGLNEMGMSDESFINVYTQFINDLRIMQPRAIIYIHAILPVTASKSSSDHTHNNTNIARRNSVLKNFAEVMKCYYVDVGPYVSDESGALIADSAADGIHMSGKYMPQWVQGLCEQAVVWPQ